MDWLAADDAATEGADGPADDRLLPVLAFLTRWLANRGSTSTLTNFSPIGPGNFRALIDVIARPRFHKSRPRL